MERERDILGATLLASVRARPDYKACLPLSLPLPGALALALVFPFVVNSTGTDFSLT